MTAVADPPSPPSSPSSPSSAEGADPSAGGADPSAGGAEPTAEGAEPTPRLPLPAALTGGLSPTLIMRLAVALTWLFWSSRFYVATFRFPGATLMTILFSLGGLAVFGAALMVRRRRAVAALDAILLAGAVLGFVMWVVSLVHTSSEYGTDEAALTQGAAQLLLHGHNPYGADLSPWLQVYGVSPDSWTTTLSGGFVHDLSYPALSFLFTVPLLAAGVVTQAQIWVNLTFFVVGAVLLWRRLPAPARNVVPLLLALDAYGSAISTGLIFGIALPFAVLAVTRWDRFGDPAASLLDRRFGPVFLGLACAVRQDLWVVVPFLAVGVALEARAQGIRPVRRALAYLGLVAVAFAAPNLPFFLWDPGAWLHGVLSPFVSGLVPLGQGLIGLSLYLGLGGGNLTLYTVAVALVVAALLAATFVWYGRLKPVLPLIPASVLFLSTRSLAQYMLFGSIIAIAAVATIRRQPRPAPLAQRARRRVLAVVALFAVAGAGTLVDALTVSPPLSVSVVSVRSTGQQGSVDEMIVSVHNAAAQAQTPRFVVGGGPYIGMPWFAQPLDGNLAVAGGATVSYRLRAPDVTSMPSISAGFKVYAFTTGPAAVSSSSLVTINNWSVRLRPNSVPRVIPVGRPLRLQAEVIDRFGRPVRQAGIDVALGQAEYASDGLFAGETVINGAAIGASPVEARTDAAGVAHFVVVAPHRTDREIFFQAWIGGGGTPQGYSDQLAVWFGDPATMSPERGGPPALAATPTR